MYSDVILKITKPNQPTILNYSGLLFIIASVRYFDILVRLPPSDSGLKLNSMCPSINIFVVCTYLLGLHTSHIYIINTVVHFLRINCLQSLFKTGNCLCLSMLETTLDQYGMGIYTLDKKYRNGLINETTFH